jgi:SAM-dependent methyltransferase
MDCPLCTASGAPSWHRDRYRDYLRCQRCSLVFVPPGFFLDPAAERAEYELHENDPADPGYRRFLTRLAEPLVERLAAGARGLDFGCGPGPALAAMLREAGFEVAVYDPFFFPDRAPLSGNYDFIAATEVVEHLHWPGEELAALWQMLEPGGYLGIMTKLVLNRDAFSRWHYKNDPTHVAFFSRDTWRWWADQHGAELEFLGDDVIVLRRER